MKYKRMNCDVLVVGAGVSGVSAAVSAARRGVSVILLEQNNFPGGTAVIARHNFICGVSRSRKGLVKEILDKVAPGERLLKRGKVLLLPFKREEMISGLTRMIKSEKKIRVFYNSRVISVQRFKQQIVSVAAKNYRARILIKPKVVIDASGDGAVIKLSKARYQLAALSRRQLSGFSFLVKKLRDHDETLAWKVPYVLTQGILAEELPPYYKFTLFSPVQSPSEGLIRLNIPPLKKDKSSKIIKQQAELIHNYLRKRLPEFKYSYIKEVSPYLSHREGIRLLGEYILSKKDLLGQKKFTDAAAYGSWPIEFWHQKKGPSFTYLKPGGLYEIPLRSLKSKDIVNLFATGRAISADPDALASTRVLGTCIALGEAAGISAAELSINNGHIG